MYEYDNDLLTVIVTRRIRKNQVGKNEALKESTAGMKSEIFGMNLKKRARHVRLSVHWRLVIACYKDHIRVLYDVNNMQLEWKGKVSERNTRKRDVMKEEIRIDKLRLSTNIEKLIAELEQVAKWWNRKTWSSGTYPVWAKTSQHCIIWFLKMARETKGLQSIYGWCSHVSVFENGRRHPKMDARTRGSIRSLFQFENLAPHPLYRRRPSFQNILLKKYNLFLQFRFWTSMLWTP